MSDAVTDSGHVILDRIPQGVDPRKHIPLSVKVSVLLRMLGLQEGDINWDHRPPLWLRKWNATLHDTVPPASDPEFIEALSVKRHDTVTNGVGGERRVTSAGSDTHVRAKCDRLDADAKAFRARVLAKAAGSEPPAQIKGKAKIPSRPKPERRRQCRATAPVEKLRNLHIRDR